MVPKLAKAIIISTTITITIRIFITIAITIAIIIIAKVMQQCGLQLGDEPRAQQL